MMGATLQCKRGLDCDTYVRVLELSMNRVRDGCYKGALPNRSASADGPLAEDARWKCIQERCGLPVYVRSHTVSYMPY